MNNYKDWIGKKISRNDIITPRLVDHFKKTIIIVSFLLSITSD